MQTAQTGGPEPSVLPARTGGGSKTALATTTSFWGCHQALWGSAILAARGQFLTGLACWACPVWLPASPHCLPSPQGSPAFLAGLSHSAELNSSFPC